MATENELELQENDTADRLILHYSPACAAAIDRPDNSARNVIRIAHGFCMSKRNAMHVPVMKSEKKQALKKRSSTKCKEDRQKSTRLWNLPPCSAV